MIWFGYDASLSQWEGGVILLVQMILPAIAAPRGGGGSSSSDIDTGQGEKPLT